MMGFLSACNRFLIGVSRKIYSDVRIILLIAPIYCIRLFVSRMSSFPSNYHVNLHQVSLTVVWCILLSVSIITALFRYDKVAAITHMIFGWIIFVYSFVFVLLFLAPFGFNLKIEQGWIFFSHGLVGTILLGLIIIQVGLGMLSRLLQHQGSIDLKKIRILRACHRYIGYLMWVTYNVLLLVAWQPGYPPAFVGFTVWAGFWFITWIFLKASIPSMQKRIIDTQTVNYVCPSVGSIKDVTRKTENYVIFANYVYDARNFERYHPGGFKVIELTKGREVDRFIYGMYSVQLWPQLQPFSHPGNSMHKIGYPIAKLVTPPTYSGINFEVNDGVIQFMRCISEKTQIFSIGIVQKYVPLVFLGYSDVRQLGQFYSLTIDNKITRLYTAVNFLSLANIQRMQEMLRTERRSEMKSIQQGRKKTKFETELPKIVNPTVATDRKEPFLNSSDNASGQYLPMMMKIYKDGKLTAALKKKNFVGVNVKFSSTRGLGLELETTNPGRIIVLAGGTGLFPFSDLIDLLYKDYMIRKNHKMSRELLAADPVLEQRPFERNTFVFLIAIAEPEDVHPITLGQLIQLSEQEDKVKVVLRVSKNRDQLRDTGKIEFTREYFNKRIVSEAAVKGLSRVWICGPPKMSSETAWILVENGYTNKQYLLI